MRATNEICELITPPCFSDWSEAVILPMPMPPQTTIPLPIATRDITTSVTTPSPMKSCKRHNTTFIPTFLS